MVSLQIADLAQALGVHRNTIRNWIDSGKLPPRVRPGRRYIITDEAWAEVSRDYGLDSTVIKVTRLGSGGPETEGRARPAERSERTVRFRTSPQWGDICLGCGSCAGACPISGVDGLDPRKAVRMIVLGQVDRLIDSSWPWKCTLCGRCQEACPMGVELVAIFRRARSLTPRQEVPAPLHQGVNMTLRRGNNLGISKDDFRRLVQELAAEMRAEGLPDFQPPLDRKGAGLMITVNSKEPLAEPGKMKLLWRILEAAGEDWTIPAIDWEGLNWGYFTGSETAMKTQVGRLVDNMRRLGCRKLLLPE